MCVGYRESLLALLTSRNLWCKLQQPEPPFRIWLGGKAITRDVTSHY